MKLILWIQDEVVKHCATGMQPHKYKGQILHKQEFRIELKGEIKWSGKEQKN